MDTNDDVFNQIIGITLSNEGGYVNNPNDSGGETNYGITKRSYPNIDIRNLSKNDAINIYKRDFWDPHPFDQIQDDGICQKLFDMSVNMGYSQAAKLLQRAQGSLTVDGVLGPLSIQAINSSDPSYLLSQFKNTIVKFYTNLVNKNTKDAAFLNGWIRRANQ